MSDKQSRLMVVLVALGLMLACSQSVEEEGPGGAVQTFYRHLNDGNYVEAKDMYNVEARATLDDPELSSSSGFRSWAEIQTKNRSISSVSILETSTDDTGADIQYEISYRDGSSKTSNVRLTLEDGDRRLAESQVSARSVNTGRLGNLRLPWQFLRNCKNCGYFRKTIRIANDNIL